MYLCVEDIRSQKVEDRFRIYFRMVSSYDGYTLCTDSYPGSRREIMIHDPDFQISVLMTLRRSACGIGMHSTD